MIEGCDDTEWVGVRTAAGLLSVRVLEGRSRATELAAVPILFLHPVNLTARCWWPVARLMPEFRRVLLDSRGHGDSHRNAPFAIADFAADVCAVIETLNLSRLHLVGASLGGSIACAVAATMPDRVQSLVALGASLEPADSQTLTRLIEWQQGGATAEMFETFLAREVAQGLAPSVAAEAKRQIGLDQRDPALIKRITVNAFAEDAQRYAPGVSCRALVLTGEFDESCPPETGQRMAAAIRGRFELLPGLGHLAMMQAPHIIVRKLIDFIEVEESL